jgi:hypothetical protein
MKLLRLLSYTLLDHKFKGEIHEYLDIVNIVDRATNYKNRWYNIFRMNTHHIHLKIQQFEPTGQRNIVCLAEHWSTNFKPI